MARAPLGMADVLSLLDRTGTMTARAVAGALSVSGPDIRGLLSDAHAQRLVRRSGFAGAFAITEHGRRMLTRAGHS